MWETKHVSYLAITTSHEVTAGGFVITLRLTNNPDPQEVLTQHFCRHADSRARRPALTALHDVPPHWSLFYLLGLSTLGRSGGGGYVLSETAPEAPLPSPAYTPRSVDSA